MDWSNRFTLGGFTVAYCTYQMAWEVIEKKGGPNPVNSINLHKFS